MLQIKYIIMSSNCFQYLLGVSEKIINGCADQHTLRKYYSLKDKILEKWTIKATDTLNTVISFEKENKKSSGTLRTSLIQSDSNVLRRSSTRQILAKSHSKQSKLLEKGRVQTFASRKSSEKANRPLNKPQEYIILSQVGTILKNAEACPSILKTVKLTLDYENEKVESILKIIEESLKNIYYAYMKPQKTEITALQDKQNSKESKFNELIKDNKWMLGKLQTLVTQNTTLRRMVGRKVY